MIIKGSPCVCVWEGGGGMINIDYSTYTHLILNIDIGSSPDQQFHRFLVTIETG